MYVILIILNSIIVNTHEIYLGFDIYESTRKFSLVIYAARFVAGGDFRGYKPNLIFYRLSATGFCA